ncbi:arabinosyltransferase domain-containing protein [Pseudonocardia sp. H11422]|uniref:arabinosyltransferase domain-containing protein n=1 Tax=Pseudonocardia sp. H11422 TaxID=2835866 RepID=UPI001BDBF20E|nr:arabinosyltransferase domain-containing protein [Pseudonocardia sp. H11422]
MLTSEQVTADGGRDLQPPLLGSRTGRWGRRAAAGLGLLAALLAIAFPFLPVEQNTAELRWPSATGGTAPVTAPLVALRPERLAADIGCVAIAALDSRSAGPATVLSTTPPTSPDGALVGLTVTVADGALSLSNRGQRLALAPLPAPTPGCTLSITSDATSTTATLGGAPLLDEDGDQRPQVVGVYSDLDGARDDIAGTAVRIAVDNRYDSSATGLKTAAGIAGVLALLGALWGLRQLDERHGRRAPRALRRPGRGRRADAMRDAVVVGVLATWLVIGSVTADDGFILTMVRDARNSGYVGNYYRWFDVPEAPFGWFYQVYAAWAEVSQSIVWLRLPAFAMGVVCWLLLSRRMLPRLGRQVRRSGAAGWAAAAVFLCFWLPFNNGLRPEPVVVLAALMALCAVEHALAVRRLLPVALGLVAAAFAVAATPTGLMAAAPFLAAGRPLLALVRERSTRDGWLGVLAPMGAAGTIVLVAVFGDQTVATVAEATRVRTEIGPNMSWFSELYRYQLLFSPTRDGSLARRFPVLLLVLCAAVTVVVLLRRGRIPGAATGPTMRLIGSMVAAFGVLALTPTKWTHHFGAFAALGAGVAALAALATSAGVLRSRRNRMLFLAAVLTVSALAFTGPNTWWYVSNWGVPWFDKPPSVNGYAASTAMLLAAAVVLVVAAVEHIRGPETGRPPQPERPGRPARSDRAGRALRLGTAPLAVVCGLLVLFEVASLAKGVTQQQGSYSLGGDVLSDPTGSRCGLAGRLLVETDTAAGVLAPAAPAGPDPAPAVINGFVPGGVPASGPGSADDTNGDGGSDATVSTAAAGPALGQVLGSYRPEGGTTASLQSEWYALPDEARRGDAPLIVAIAGRLGDGSELTLEFGRADGERVETIDRISPDGSAAVASTADPDGVAASGRGWRDLRLDLAGRDAGEADRVRVLAEDRSLNPEGWLAVAPPRVPRLTPLTDIAAAQPGMLDWPTTFPNPCLRPFAVTDGIAEVPAFRLLADPQQRGVGETWSSASAGGPLAWIPEATRQRVVPLYLDGQWDRDPGQFRLLTPWMPDGAAPEIVTGTRERWGWQQDGPMGDPPAGRPSIAR